MYILRKFLYGYIRTFRLGGNSSFFDYYYGYRAILYSSDTQDAIDAVEKVKKNLYDPSGGVIAQFEFGPGTNPEIATAIFEAWDKV
jgi:hypothetical protein